jgi:peptidoglycan L-alanyl-D-glutamate endopeptidase CwlK
MTYKFGQRSEDRLTGIHPDLVKVVRRALQISKIDFAVVEGLRTIERQAELFKSGASQTMNSRHLTGHAIDLAPVVGNQVRWDWPLFAKIAEAMKAAAAESNIPVEWGGDWRKFKDGPHWQLTWKAYP